MGDLMLLPAVLLPVIAIAGWVISSRTPQGRANLRLQNRYIRNRLLFGLLFAVLVIGFGLHTHG